MHLAAAIALIGGLVFLAHLFAAIFSRTRIPDVLWLLLIGVALGPVFHLLAPAALGVVGPAFVSITLVLILFESGLSLQLSRLRRALPGTVALSSASFLGEAAVVALASWGLTPLGAWRAALLGLIVAGNSPSVIVPMAKGLGLADHTRDILFLESALGDVFSIVLALALLDFQAHGWGRWLAALARFGLGFGGALLLGGLAGLAWSLALRRTRGLENPMFTTPAFVFLVYGGAELLRANGTIAVLALGIVLANVEHSPLVQEALPAVGLNRAEMGFLSEIVFLLKTFFFVYIGLSVRFSDLRWLLLGAGLSLLLLAPRIPAVRLTLRRRVSLRDASFAACMIPKGLAAAVLAALLVQQQVPGAEILQSIIYAMIFFGVVFTSILVFVVHQPFGARAMAWLLGRAPEPAGEGPGHEGRAL
ncbi:MAG TPA: cation:proton antiporter [Terriglobales bacterium]|nr:cation:proton antiporter [Terriglobales bacterium]